jgi:hypothetical protein
MVQGALLFERRGLSVLKGLRLRFGLRQFVHHVLGDGVFMRSQRRDLGFGEHPRCVVDSGLRIG